VRETDNSLEVTAELPGLSDNDVELRLEGDLITLSGEKKEESKREEGGLHLTERSFGRFQRSFRLPFRPDPAEVKAEFDKGVLHITLPKPQMEQSGGRIPIQAGSSGQRALGESKGGSGASGQQQQPPVSAAPQAGSAEKKGG
jgi:HSP20 family protein